MRLAYFTPGAPEGLGGIETLGQFTLEALRQRGHEVTLICSAAQERVEPGRVGLPFARAVEERDPALMLSLGRRLDQHLAGSEVVLYQFSPWTSFWACRPGPPVVMTYHHPNAAGLASYLRKLAPRAAAVTTVSQASRAELASLGIKASVLYPGQAHPPIPDLPVRPRTLLAGGRLAPEKGFDVLLQAVARIESGCHLRLVGHGPLEGELRALATSLGLAVEFGPALPRPLLWEAMASSAMVCVPSRQEPFGLMALEAYALGRPVIASRVDGLAEQIEDGVTGLLVEPDRPDLLAEAIERLLADPALGARLGAAGAVRARERFTIEAYVDGLLSVCRRVLAEK